MKHFAYTAFVLLLATFAYGQENKVTTETVAKNKSYTIINSGEAIVIYKYIHKAHAPREADKYGPKYFFSTPASNVVLPLTKDNLKATYPDNHPFHDALDANFKDEADLTRYDNFHKMYKVNWLLKNNPPKS
jgi:hypothetical protein